LDRRIRQVFGVFTDHHINPESGLSFVLGGHRLFESDFNRVQIEVTLLGGITLYSAVYLGISALSGEVIAVTGIDVSAELDALLGGLNEVILNHLFRILSGCFRGAVREGKAGHGRKYAKKGCNILDHFIYYLLFVFVFVFELEPSRYFHQN
jgi:hypothetical protein